MTFKPKDKAFDHAVVVNDDLLQRKLIAEMLEQQGLVVRSYGSAAEALGEMSPNTPPHLIVTDLFMPGIDGWRFCRLLRSPEYSAFNKTPLVVVSATFSGMEARSITADLGADAFIPIPYEPKQWEDLVQSLRSGKRYVPPCPVMIVDDEPALAEMLSYVFARHGYQPVVVTTGQEARQLFKTHKANIVILDYHLPDIDGGQLLVEFRQQDPFSIIIMITGDPSPHLATQFMQQGAAAYARKPVDANYLIELCDHAVRERSLLRVEEYLEERTRQLRRSEAQYRGLFNTMVSGFALFEILADAQGKPSDYRFLEVNPAFENMLGLNRDQVVDRTLLTVMPAMEPQWKDTFSQAGQSAKPVHFEGYNRTLNKYLEGVVFNPQAGHVAMTFVDITPRKTIEKERERLILELQEALLNVKTLSGLLPICSGCKKIRDDSGYWNQIESYIQKHSDARFSHSLCPECLSKYMPKGINPKSENGAP